MTEPPLNPKGEAAARRVLQFSFSVDLFERNYVELRTCLHYMSDPVVANTLSDVEARWRLHEALREVAYLLHNFVAAAKSLVDHSRVVYRHLYAPAGLIPTFAEEIRVRFKSDPLSQFVVGLREMAQHYRLPTIYRHWQFTNAPGGGTTAVRLLLKHDDLRTFDGWRAPAKQYLDAAGTEVDVWQFARAYHDHVMRFYQWFQLQQQVVHGAGPEMYARLARHGGLSREPYVVAQLEANLAELEKGSRDDLSYDTLFDALEPALSGLDMRTLVLCRHNGRLWLHEALALVESRVDPGPRFRSRVFALVFPDG